ncbi:ferrichrome-iron receptor [Aquitalea magnusonii]|uniref:Ferrichrome-iron receptor n=1 Tax=Aquitalea magnusonii TaxID=332411 RepID=A0A3G9GEP1_9NEIS|nr:TonB-dependent siderophore receptor [Aquitalea magnusonii]BBF84572.1 ferrichrome-iron receptor [Aquitalea magnusonii]
MSLRMTPIAIALAVATFPTVLLAEESAKGNVAADAAELSTVVVTAEKPPLAAAYAAGQVSKAASVGVLGKQAVLDTPFSITSYTAQLIEDQQAKTLADVMQNDPSVRFTTSSGHAYENYRIRGFDVSANDLAINGMYGLAPYGHTPVEFIEQVEVLKGPSALFSGMAPSGGVGGVINLVPKRAADTPLTRVSVGFQSDSQLGTTLDVGRRYGEDNEWGVRVNAALSDGDTTLSGQSKKRDFLSAALDYRGQQLKASLDAYYSKETFSGGTPAMYWFATSAIPAALDASTNLFPNAQGTLESKAAILRGEYALNDAVSLFAGLGTMRHDYDGFINGTHARSIQANGNFSGRMVAQRGYDENVSAEAGIRSRFNTGSIGHELVVHASELQQESGSAVNMTSFSSNLYAPVTAVMPSTPSTAPKTGDVTLSSLALMDTLSLLDDRLKLTLGLRSQRVQTTSYNSAGATTASYDKSAVSPAVGVVVKPWGPAVSLYANYVEGLSKGDTVTDTAATNYNQVFSPYKTEQKEMGLKWDAGSFTHSASLFEITKPTLVAIGSTANPTYVDSGEKRVRGLEWSTSGELTRALRLLGGITYSQGVQTKTAYGQYDGKRAVGVPHWQGNMGVEWDTPWVSGLTLSSRVMATSSLYLDAANTQQISGWSQLDLGARYTTRVGGKKTVFRAGVDNVFNRHYYSGSFSDSTPIATLGQARTYTVSATTDF